MSSRPKRSNAFSRKPLNANHCLQHLAAPESTMTLQPQHTNTTTTITHATTANTQVHTRHTSAQYTPFSSLHGTQGPLSGSTTHLAITRHTTTSHHGADASDAGATRHELAAFCKLTCNSKTCNSNSDPHVPVHAGIRSGPSSVDVPSEMQ